MKIIDLNEKNESLYFVCLEDWSEEIKEAGDHKCRWYLRMRERGLRVKLALDDSGAVGGMIQYIPVEHSFAAGHDLFFILCIWVHGYQKGRGNFQKKGMGKALLQAAEADAKERGARGIAAWGISFPFWMKASWFKKQGYRKVDKQGMQILLWKPFKADAHPPEWIKEKKRPVAEKGRVVVTSFINGWCPAMSLTHERAKRAASEFPDSVVFRMVDTSERGTFLEWGISDALFIGSGQVRTGPPPTYDKIRKKIARQVKRL